MSCITIVSRHLALLSVFTLTTPHQKQYPVLSAVSKVQVLATPPNPQTLTSSPVKAAYTHSEKPADVLIMQITNRNSIQEAATRPHLYSHIMCAVNHSPSAVLIGLDEDIQGCSCNFKMFHDKSPAFRVFSCMKCSALKYQTTRSVLICSEQTMDDINPLCIGNDSQSIHPSIKGLLSGPRT